MVFKTCIKKIVRTPKKSLLFLLLLTMGGTLISLGVSLFITAKDTREEAEKVFTTIAAPNVVKIRKDSGGDNAWVVDGGTIRTADNFMEIMNEDEKRYQQIMQTGAELGIGVKDSRQSYYAYSDGLLPLLHSVEELNFPYNIAVFEVVCESIEDTSHMRPDFIPKSTDKMHQVKWKVIKPITLHPSYEVPDTLTTNGYIQGIKMGVEIEAGKRYLIAGEISNYKMKNDAKNLMESPVGFSFFYAHITQTNEEKIFEEGYFIPYIELKKDVEVFLNSKEGVDFKRLVDNSEKILHSAHVITTDNVNSVLQFNQKKAYITKGREILPKEYAEGERVCIISSEFAEFNQINVGDDIELSLASASYKKQMAWKETAWLFDANPYSIPYSKEQFFKVVGIYQTPKWERNEYMLTPNSIFIPSKSIDGSAYNPSDAFGEIVVPPILYSIILPNNKLEEFKAKIELKGMGEYFIYYDQGYSNVKGILETLSQNAVVMFSVCVVVWLMVLFLFLLLYVVQEKKNVGIMLSLGAGRKRTIGYLFITCFLLAFPSALFSSILSNGLEERVTELSYRLAVEQSSFNESFSDMDSADQGYNPFNKSVDEKGEYRNSFLYSNSNRMAIIVGGLQFLMLLCISYISISFLVKKSPRRLLNSREG